MYFFFRQESKKKKKNDKSSMILFISFFFWVCWKMFDGLWNVAILKLRLRKLIYSCSLDCEYISFFHHLRLSSLVYIHALFKHIQSIWTLGFSLSAFSLTNQRLQGFTFGKTTPQRCSLPQPQCCVTRAISVMSRRISAFQVTSCCISFTIGSFRYFS